MIRSGLVSITFRQLPPREIIDLVSEAGLDGIEWGGDVHVPHGDLRRAREVSRMTTDAGLVIASYGSYYRAGTGGLAFEWVLETALELRAPTIRVWAGDRGSDDADEAHWARVIGDSRRIAEMAGRNGVDIAFEFHVGTLTDTNSSAVRLLSGVCDPTVGSYWQPRFDCADEYRLEGLSAILPWLSNVHVFTWSPEFERLPLRDGADVWAAYLRLASSTSRDIFALLEFVKDDSQKAFIEDARTLKQWLRAADAA